MTVRAARCVRKMGFAIGMTRQARLACERRLIAMPGVTAFAVLMFGHLMQAEQARRLMARGARGDRGRAESALVRLMAVAAPSGHAAVLRARFGHVAAGTSRRGRHRARVRLVTIGTFGVATGRAVGLLLMATLAGSALCAAVWLVALRALGVTGLHLTQLLRVTAAARDQHRLRVVRQTAVTIAALLVPGAQRDASQLLCVAVATQRLPQLFQRECVRGMALRAGEALMKILIRVG